MNDYTVEILIDSKPYCLVDLKGSSADRAVKRAKLTIWAQQRTMDIDRITGRIWNDTDNS